LAPSAALDCLTPPAAERGEPEYPPMRLKSGAPGRVKASAVFAGNDWLPGPTIRIEALEGGDAFEESVKTFLRKLRVPCLQRDTQATLVFDFVFDPKSPKVYWFGPVDADDAGRKKLLDCIVHERGEKRPDYPQAALRSHIQGRVWASVRFVAPDKAPEVKLHHRPSASLLAHSAERWLAGQRMPCLQGAPLAAEMSFVFVLERDVYGFKALGLMQLIGNVKGIREQRVSFDTTTMGCPFDLKFTYRQPDLKNLVGEVEARDPARRPLMDWLATAELDVRGTQLDSIYADTADVTVPCIKIDLKPKEKTQ
jgi:hypothetical protein